MLKASIHPHPPWEDISFSASLIFHRDDFHKFRSNLLLFSLSSLLCINISLNTDGLYLPVTDNFKVYRWVLLSFKLHTLQNTLQVKTVEAKQYLTWWSHPQWREIKAPIKPHSNLLQKLILDDLVANYGTTCPDMLLRVSWGDHSTKSVYHFNQNGR